MVALSRDDLVLALFAGEPAPGTVYEICVALPSEETDPRIDDVSGEADLVERRAGFARLDDPFGFRWVVQSPELTFRSSGEIADRWLEV